LELESALPCLVSEDIASQKMPFGDLKELFYGNQMEQTGNSE
jgi:hypothetical protein